MLGRLRYHCRMLCYDQTISRRVATTTAHASHSSHTPGLVAIICIYTMIGCGVIENDIEHDEVWPLTAHSRAEKHAEETD